MNIDLDAYFHRIGHTGARTATFETLAGIQLAHPAAIPFENLDPVMGRPVTLDVAPLQAKLVHGQRGGYCYEQNLLLMHVLRALGFTVGGLAARVLWGRPEDAVTARTHMLLRIDLEGRTWIVDVGFGGLTQTAPLLLEPNLVQQTPHEPFRVIERDGYFLVQADVGDEWRTLYRFDLSEHVEADYAIPSYFLSTNPASHFVSGLVVARALPDRRLALSGNRYTEHLKGTESRRREIETAGELIQVLTDDFGIVVPDEAVLAGALAAKGIVIR